MVSVRAGDISQYYSFWSLHQPLRRKLRSDTIMILSLCCCPEYEREGILWKFISFPDNQDVLDLIDRKHTGILALLDEQCIVPKSDDHKFTRYLYAKCDEHARFGASSAQRVDYKFSIEHYAGPVEYSTENWLEKNKDQLPASSAELLKGAKFDLLAQIQVRKYMPTFIIGG